MIYHSQFTGGTWDTMGHYQLLDYQGAEISNLAYWVYMQGLLFHFILSSFNKCWWNNWCVPGSGLDHGWKLGKWRCALFPQGLQSLQRMWIWKWIHYHQVAESKNKGLGTTLWHMQVLACEAGKALEKRWYFNHRSFLDTHSASGVPAWGTCKGIERESSVHLWEVPISTAGMWVSGWGVAKKKGWRSSRGWTHLAFNGQNL